MVPGFTGRFYWMPLYHTYYQLPPPHSHTHTHTHTHTSAPPKEALSEQKEHKKLIEKGKPEDVPPGIKHRKVGN